ncbi:hypothetical protein SHKM778_74080 [Streptomyces sp. KM77-8]|uniref:Uncharacterized protein n=1 Tax=Streptomyces haneummycinicus TaxID=3074435 RepID=A0AAT9HUG5_9ACTN
MDGPDERAHQVTPAGSRAGADEAEQAVRLALRMIGEEAGRTDRPGDAMPGVLVSRRPDPRRRRRTAAVWAAAVAACAAVAVTVTFSGLLSGKAPGDSAAPPGTRSTAAAEGGQSTAADEGGQGQTLPEWIACARTIVVGDVTEVAPNGEGRIEVGLDVEEWIKPARGDRRFTMDVVDPRVAQDRPPIEEGTRVLVVLPRRADQAADTFEGGQLTRYRSAVMGALDDAGRTTCPAPWN